MVSLTSIVILAVAISMASGLQTVKINMSGRDLPNMDIFNGAPDALLYVNYAESVGSGYEEIGRTDDISDNSNPDWPEVYSITYTGGRDQKIKFDVYDADSPDEDDYMGYVEFDLGELVSVFGGVLEKDIIGGNPGGGYIIIRGTITNP